MSQNLEDAGSTVVPFGQGFKDMFPSSEELMKLALEGRLAHDGHPMLSWMVDNIHMHSDPAGNTKPDKQNPPRRSAVSWPQSRPSRAPPEAAAPPWGRQSTTNEAYSFYSPPQGAV